jgi:sensor c-di-GMP phosphodiesterase-like protein
MSFAILFKNRGRRFTASILLVVMMTGIFAVSAQFLSENLANSERERQLNELAGIALRRAETAVDHGNRTLAALQAKGALECGASAIQSVRLDIYRGGAVKDIRILSPSGLVLCSAFPETLEFDLDAVIREDMAFSESGSVYLYPAELFFGSALGIMRDFGERGAIAAVLGVGGSALDVLPGDLRDHGDVALEMRDGRIVASANGNRGEASLIEQREFSVTSQRYPLRAVIRISKPAFGAWNAGLYRPIIALAALLGTVIAILLARPLLRPETPLSELDRALAARQFEPFYQPIFEIGTGRIKSAEVLARWVTPDGKVHTPARFIDLAEQTGRVRQLTWQIVDKALAQARGMLDADPEFYLAFNFAPQHFVEPGVPARLREAARKAGVRPGQVCAEITERQGFEDPELAASSVAQLKEAGFRVAIDDVGIGHSGCRKSSCSARTRSRSTSSSSIPSASTPVPTSLSRC